MAGRIQEILAIEPGTKRSDAEKQVGKENGMSDRRVRQFVALLKLSPEAQELAQQARLSENALRQITGIKDSLEQLAAVRELIRPSQKKTTAHSLSKSSAHRKPGHGQNGTHTVKRDQHEFLKYHRAVVGTRAMPQEVESNRATTAVRRKQFIRC